MSFSGEVHPCPCPRRGPYERAGSEQEKGWGGIAGSPVGLGTAVGGGEPVEQPPGNPRGGSG